jgi:hypothetical protein
MAHRGEEIPAKGFATPPSSSIWHQRRDRAEPANGRMWAKI